MRLPKIAPLILTVIILTAATVSAGPILTVQPESFDFGYAPQNAKVNHLFTLTNTGNETLVIDRVVPGCGCTQAPLKDKILEAGESTELEITFSTGHYQGQVTKRPRIESNGADKPISVDIITDVITRPDSAYPVTVRPYKLDISQFGERERDRLGFNMTNVSDKDVTLTLVAYPSELMTVTLPDAIEAGATIEGEIVLLPAALDESFEKTLTLEFNDSGASRYSIPIKRTFKSVSAQMSADQTSSRATGQ
jgi:hypothetical protein